ncbi:hypothetical protein ALP94_04486 [Pseudomonas savastanoi pv. glycinea]|nr:hypothetical protein ALP94_04486 [Pseudomonas savastanoi pv. glycinea]
MNHWQLLGLTPEADERSIKRAYARLLKVHRPDQNSEDFQRLREAYETSLAHARWRAQADDDVAFAPADSSAPNLEVFHPLDVSQPVEVPALVTPLDLLYNPTAISPPEPSLGQMQQWLSEGKERQVLDALRLWLSSDWLLPFERRQHFEQLVLDWLESAPEWSAAFFDGVCQAMGWDEAQGHIPCEYWRWDRLIQRCETLAMEASIRAELARFDADKINGQAAALLLKPMSDRRRRGLADYFTGLDWQRFTQLAQTIESNPEIPQRLGLKPLDNWRDWLPAANFRGVYLFLWLTLSVLVVVSLLAGSTKREGMGVVAVMPLVMPVLMWFGMKGYEIWALVAVMVGQMDVLLSRWLIPRRWYRQGAGLLLFRHILPAAVPSATAYAWSHNLTWLQWISPVLVFIGTLYFTNDSLRGGKISIWNQALRAIKLKVGRLPWHMFQREGFLVFIVFIGMAAFVYLRMKPVAW